MLLNKEEIFVDNISLYGGKLGKFKLKGIYLVSIKLPEISLKDCGFSLVEAIKFRISKESSSANVAYASPIQFLSCTFRSWIIDKYLYKILRKKLKPLYYLIPKTCAEKVNGKIRILSHQEVNELQQRFSFCKGNLPFVLQGNARRILSLERALEENPDILIFDALGCSNSGAEELYGLVSKYVEKGGCAIELCFPYIDQSYRAHPHSIKLTLHER